jgi:serine O-acetyltransferase
LRMFGPAFDLLRADFAVNRDHLSRLVLVVYRLGQWSATRRGFAASVVAGAHRALNLVIVRAIAGADLPAFEAGGGLRLHHAGRGVCVNRRAVLGSNVTIYQHVSIGNVDDRGSPTIGDGVYIGAGACVLGAVLVGDGARIGANATVVMDVPPYATVIGPKAQIRSEPD